MNILKHNRAAWDKQVEQKNKWTLPVSSAEIAKAKKGKVKIVLTPKKNVPADWYGNVYDKDILCLAGGGGQQGPLFAAMGAKVTVFDNSPKQLQKDVFVANRESLKINIVQGDMKDLSCFKDKSFDLIFHPVSNCFVPDIAPVWKECYRVLKKGGVLLSGFANPLLYIFDFEEWDRNTNLKVRYKVPYSDTKQLSAKQLKARVDKCLPLEYGHTLEQQINGQLQAGFVLTSMYEDSANGDLLDSYINTFIATKAVKL